MKLRNKDKLYLYERDNKKCFYCGKDLKFKQITIDHLLPLSKGGTHDIFNIVISCKKCNKIKGNSLPKDIEAIILNLFIKAVEDDIIIGKGLNVDNKKLKEELLKVERIEQMGNQFIFQSKTMRFYIKDSCVIRTVYLGGSNEYYHYFRWED